MRMDRTSEAAASPAATCLRAALAARASLVLAGALCLATPARAQTVDLNRVANGVLGMLAWTVTPDTTASGITIGGGSGGGEDTLTFVQLGVGERVLPDIPLYLEGFLGLASFNPDYVVGVDGGAAQIGGRWSSFAATVGVGWEFPILENLVLRPILNASFGQVTTESRFAPILPRSQSERVLDDDDLFAFGYGASIMLDYELRRPTYEVDVELRFTNIELISIDGTREYDDASATARAASLWTRLRVPSGITAFDRPLRAVFELAHTEFLGDQTEIGFRRLSQVGVGAELDFSATRVPLDRARVVTRFLIGSESVGAALGFGFSF